MSKIVPNTTQTPNLYLDKLLLLLDHAELKTLLYAVRRIMGFHKQSDRISLSQFMAGNGHIDDDGEPVEYGTGLSKSTQVAALKRLVDFGLLLKVSTNTKNRGDEWTLQIDGRRIKWNALWERYETRRQRGKKRTHYGRVAADARRRQGSLMVEPPRWSNQQTTCGLMVEPHVVQPLDHQAVQPLDLQKKDRKPVRKPVRNSDKKNDDANLEITWGRLVEFTKGDQQRAAHIWQLQQCFVEASKIQLPDIGNKDGRNQLEIDWWPIMTTILNAADGNVEIAMSSMETAVIEQHKWKPSSIVLPQSILKKTQGVLAGIKRGGRTAAANSDVTYEYAQIPVGEFGI